MFRKTILIAFLYVHYFCYASLEKNPLELVTQIKPVQQIILSYLSDSWEQVRTLDYRATGVEQIVALDYSKTGVEQIAVSPDGEYAAIVLAGESKTSGYNNPGVDIINIKKGKVLHHIQIIYQVGPAAFLCGGKYIALGEKDGNRVTVFNTVMGKQIQSRAVATFYAEQNRPAMTHFGSTSDSTQLVTFLKNNKISRWDFAKNQLHQLNFFEKPIAQSPNCKYIAIHAHGNIDVCQQLSTNCLYCCHDYRPGLKSVGKTDKLVTAQFSPDSKYLAFKYSQQNLDGLFYSVPSNKNKECLFALKIMDISESITTLGTDHTGKILCFSPCGNFLVEDYCMSRQQINKEFPGGWEHAVTIWDIKKKNITQMLCVEKSFPKHVCFTADSYLIIAWSDAIIRIYKNDRNALELAHTQKSNLITLCGALLKLDEYYFW